MSLVGSRATRINGVSDLKISNGSKISSSTITVVNRAASDIKSGEINSDSFSGSRSVVSAWYTRVGNINNNNIELSTAPLNGEEVPVITHPLTSPIYNGFFMVSASSALDAIEAIQGYGR